MVAMCWAAAVEAPTSVCTRMYAFTALLSPGHPHVRRRPDRWTNALQYWRFVRPRGQAVAQAKKKAPPRRKAVAPARPAAEPDGLAPGGGRGLVSLGQLLDNMGPSVAQVIVAPKGLEVPVGDPVIYDAIERSTPEKDSIALAVGVSPDGSEARELLKGAAAAEAAIVVFKLRDRTCDVVPDAEA